MNKTLSNSCFRLRVLLGMVGLLSAVPLSAEAALSGQEIATKIDEREDGDDQVSHATWKLIPKRGRERIRETIRHWKDEDGEGGLDTKSLMFFEAPPEVKNSAFLNWSYKDVDRDDDQWLYLPQLRKIRRISASDKGKSFMGTDFTYDDMGDRQVDEDIHAVLREEVYKEKECYVLESKPKDPAYIYSRRLRWVDKEEFVVYFEEFYDRHDRLLKTLDMEWMKVDGIWTWKHALMNNVQTGHATEVDVANVQFNTGIDDDFFSERSLRRGTR